jgi:hypothetical protein
MLDAVVLRAQGNTDAARATLSQAFDMLHNSMGDTAPWTQQAQAELARVPAK